MSRSWLRFVLGLLAVVVVAELGARALMATSTPSLRWYDHTAALKIDELDERGRLDTVFAGTSMAWQAFVPGLHTEASGDSGYNVGLAGGTPEVMDRWLTEEIEPRVRPKTVVWGLSSLDLAPNYGEENAEAYDTAPETSQGLLNEIDRTVSDVSTLVAERRVLRDPSELWGDGKSERDEQKSEAERYLGTDGERLDFREDLGAESRRVMQARLADFEIDQIDAQTIEQTVDRLAEAGIEVVLVELPVPQRFIELHPNGADDHALVGPALSEIAQRTGSRFLRLTDGYSNEDFVDFTHLDEDGVARFMREFELAYASDRDDAGTIELDSVDPVDSPSEDCRLETIVDEYGFEIEVCVEEPPDAQGGEAPASQAVTPTTESVLLPSSNIDPTPTTTELIYSGVVDAALRPCSSTGWGSARLSALSVEHREVVDHLFALRDEIADDCSLPLSAAELGPILVDLEKLSGRTRPMPKGEPFESVEYSSRLAAALDEVYNRLVPSDETRTHMWSYLDEFGAAYEFARRRESGDPIEAIAVGSSMAAWQLDQTALAAAFGHRFLNIGQPGLDAEEWELLLPAMIEQEQIETIIWATSTHRMINDTGLAECGSGLERVDRAVSSRQDLAALTGWKGPTMAALIGEDPSKSPYLATAIRSGLEERFDSPGDRVVRSGQYTFDGINSSETAGRYRNPALCELRIEALERILIEALGRGVDVVLLALPVHAEVIGLAPQVHREADSALEDLAKRLQVAYVQVDSLDDSETHDGVHTNATGRKRVTSELIRKLDVLGLS